MNEKKHILITGAAGFIGYHLCKSLANDGYYIFGIDNINDYYDQDLKFERLKNLGIKKDCSVKYGVICTSSIFKDRLCFIRAKLENSELISSLFQARKFDFVCNLAAQAGVRYSLKNPKAYINSNINGFINILEACKQNNVNRLVYASSSSVYGNSKNTPFKESLKIDQPISLYAATKKSNELMAHVYSHLYDIETIGLRFFTVYGEWGRPDMAYYLFTDAIFKKKPIKIFNRGILKRDFTHIEDIVEGVKKTLLNHSKYDKSKYRIYNIGNGNPIVVNDFIDMLENEIGKKAIKKYYPMQDGDVLQTMADTSKIEKDYEYKPKVELKEKIGEFINWYKGYNKIY